MSGASGKRLSRLGALGIALGLTGAFVGYQASAQDFAITNATVATGDGSAPMEGATVVVRGGKVVVAGPGVALPADVQNSKEKRAFLDAWLISVEG